MTARLLLVLAVLGLTMALFGCVAGDPEKAEAARAAREWANREGGGLAADLGPMLSTEFPITSAVDAAVLQEEIRDTLGWSFSSPTLGQYPDQYEVIARAKAKPRIRIGSMPIRAYDIRVTYVLTVDARGRGVISYQLDMSKVIIRDVSSSVFEP